MFCKFAKKYRSEKAVFLLFMADCGQNCGQIAFFIKLLKH